MPNRNVLKVTEAVLSEAMALRVAAEEAHLIAPNPAWLAEAAHLPEAMTFLIAADGAPVGLISVLDPRLVDADDREDFQEDCLYLWRLMIDRGHRGAGHGRAAVAFATALANALGLDGLSLTTMDRAPRNALGFYEGLGFVPTGRRIDGEIELVRRGAEGVA